MKNKLLTYLTILAISVLPVQLISASAEFTSMQMSMSQAVEMKGDCLHDNEVETAAIEKSCCENQAYDCQSCNNCPQAVSIMFPAVPYMAKSLLSDADIISNSHLVLDGVPQKGLLRPPQGLI